VFVGVDVGSQSLKAFVLDADLAVVGSGRRTYVVSFPRPGWAEQAPDLWEAALGPAIADALAAAGCAPGEVTAFGLAGQLDGCVPTGRDGRALASCLVWMDRRADAVLDGVRRGIGAAAIRARTGANLDGCHLAPKIRWCLDHLPEARDAVCFHQPVSYLVAQLTGARVMDHGLASTSLVYDLARADYAADLLDAFGLDRAMLADVAPSESVAGRLTAAGAALTGLPAGIPVAVGTGDDFSTPLGGGVGAPGILADVLGTAEVVGALDPRPLIDETGLLETHRFVGSSLNYIENPGWISGGALEWLRGLLGIADFAAFDGRAAGAPPGCDGLLFLPALTGAMTPEWIAGARGCFYGLTPAHDAAALARAALEGTAFGLRDVATRLVEMGVPLASVRVLGGGARSRLWAQIRADVTGYAVERTELADTSAVGAGVLAAVAAGAYSDVATAAARVGEVVEVVEPNPARRGVYDDAYGRYVSLFAALKPMFGASSGREEPCRKP
jgi:xylulokinase